MSSTPLSQLELIRELLEEDIIPRLYQLERRVHVHAEELSEVHGEIHWLDENLRIKYPEWYQSSEDNDEE